MTQASLMMVKWHIFNLQSNRPPLTTWVSSCNGPFVLIYQVALTPPGNSSKICSFLKDATHYIYVGRLQWLHEVQRALFVQPERCTKNHFSLAYSAKGTSQYLFVRSRTNIYSTFPRVSIISSTHARERGCHYVSNNLIYISALTF